MTREIWAKRIRDACESAGTYKEFYDDVIYTLAGIMAIHDEAERKYIENGGEPTVEHTNARGATNVAKNPALVVLMDCNAQALAYWAQLGLTPKSYKAMTGSLNARAESRSLEDLLAEMEE